MRLAKPCPSCGSPNHELRFNTETGDYYVECRACHMTGSRKQDPNAAIAAWNDLPRFHGVPQAPNEFWRGRYLRPANTQAAIVRQMQQVQLRLNVLEAQVASLFRMAELVKQYMEAGVEYLTGVKDVLGDFGEGLKSYEEKVRESI